MYLDNKVIFIALPLYITTRDFKSNNQDVAEAQTSVFPVSSFYNSIFITVRITDILYRVHFQKFKTI